jgi:demethoxyubiquinone hydroxylase (CLK1/Coq7/Cat5 family)
MKNRIVFWGKNENSEKLLLALELLADEGKVNVISFPEVLVSEEFNQTLTKDWRDGKTVDFPEGFASTLVELTVTGSILPAGITAEKMDLVTRAQAEWNFSILSSRLFRSYQSELNEFKDKVERSLNFDKNMWDELKSFWDRVQEQARDKSLFREHSEHLRQETNELFGKLKDLRGKLDEEFDRTSKTLYEDIVAKLGDIENKVREGIRLQPLFDELKDIQKKIREVKLNRDHRNKIWDKLDATFKVLKEKRFGPETAEDNNPLVRIQKRYEGLMAAIDKMESSVGRDVEELNFQNGKVNTSFGQLEAQIRQAKVAMIEERIRSKKEKLAEMYATKTELDRKMEQLQEKEKRKADEMLKEDAKKAAQAKIANEIAAANAAREKSKDSLLGAAAAILGDSITDMVDTVKAVAEVVEDRIEDKIDEIKEIWNDKKEGEEKKEESKE